MRVFVLNLLALACLFHCHHLHDPFDRNVKQPVTRMQGGCEDTLYNYKGGTIQTRIKTPDGYRRTATETGSFGSFLRNLPLKPHGSNVLIYDGSVKPGEVKHVAVVNMDIGDKDLQQCADAIIRLRAEYLFQRHQFEQISFHFTNGERADYIRFAEGYRAIEAENTIRWIKKAQPDYSRDAFMDYLELVFTYAGSYSLSREMISVKNIADMRVGDVFIQGGFPGHAVIVVDMIVHEKTGQKQFLLAQSYMPAQEIHLLKNPAGNAPWYPLASSGKLVTPDWIFDYGDLKRFNED